MSSSGKVEVIRDLSTEVTSVTNTKDGVKVKWTQAPSASGYYVYRRVSYTGEYKKIKKIKGKTTTSYTDKEVKNNNGIKYDYKIIPYKGSDQGSGAAGSIFRLTGTSLSSVKSVKSKQMTVKWQKAYKVTGYSITKQGYQIQYSTNKNFKKGTQTKTKKVTNISKNSKTIKSLKKGKTYYVRIRTYANVYGTEYYSAWSSKKKVKVK